MGGDDADVEVESTVYLGLFRTLYQDKDKKLQKCVCRRVRAGVRMTARDRPASAVSLLMASSNTGEKNSNRKLQCCPLLSFCETAHHPAPVLVRLRGRSTHSDTMCLQRRLMFRGANEREEGKKGAESVC